ncbi:hypothetical protein GCM10009845_38780 [Pedococcus bigeumensis]
MARCFIEGSYQVGGSEIQRSGHFSPYQFNGAIESCAAELEIPVHLDSLGREAGSWESGLANRP